MSTSLNKILILYITQFYLLKTNLLEGYGIEAFLETWYRNLKASSIYDVTL